MAYTTIDDPSAYFHTQLYTGNGSSGLSITNDANAGNFQPDFLWIKPRSGSDNHVLFDSSRGQDKQLKLNSADAEDTHSPARITFETDGFDLDTTDGNYNGNTTTYVAWQWKANAGSTTSQTGSDINSVTQVNSTSKFGIMTYTGASNADADSDNNSGAYWRIKHGLGSTPKVLIIKNRGTAGWYIWHHGFDGASTTDGDHLYLPANSVMASEGGNILWGNTAFSSTEIEVGAWNVVNRDSQTFIGYYWDEVKGFSKHGFYKGNGNANGPFVYLGFKPAFVMIKCTSQSEPWFVVDTSRSADNPTLEALIPNANDAENTTDGYSIDLLSNGFKCRADSGQQNEGAGHYVYMAFAEHPFVSSEGVPCTAR